MKKIKTLSIFLVLMTFSIIVSAGKQREKEIPPWMEQVESTGKNIYLVPKGTKRKTVGTHIIAESANEYAARRIFEMEQYLEKRLKEIEKKQKDFQKRILKELEESKEAIDKLKKEKDK